MLNLSFKLTILEEYRRLNINGKSNIWYLVIAKTYANNDKLQKNKEKKNILVSLIVAKLCFRFWLTQKRKYVIDIIYKD